MRPKVCRLIFRKQHNHESEKSIHAEAKKIRFSRIHKNETAETPNFMAFNFQGLSVGVCRLWWIIRSEMSHVNVLTAIFPGFLQLNRFPDFAAFSRDFRPAMFLQIPRGAIRTHTARPSTRSVAGIRKGKTCKNAQKTPVSHTKNAVPCGTAQANATNFPDHSSGTQAVHCTTQLPSPT